MINNDSDLMPLVAKNDDRTPPAEDTFLMNQVADTYDSVELLLTARAEAEQAEAEAKKAGGTPLPFLKEEAEGAGKKAAFPPLQRPKSFSVSSTPAADQDSPAPILALDGQGLTRLSDATAVQTPSLKDFLRGQMEELDAEDILPALGPKPAYIRPGNEADDDNLLGEGISDVDGTEAVQSLADMHIDELLQMTVRAGASDLHLTVHLPPMIRKDGKLTPLPFDPATDRDTQRIVYDILNSHQIEVFERTHELDFSYGVKGIGRFRFNVYRQRSSVSCAMRVIPNKIPTMEQLKLPSVLRELTRKHSGLVLVTGPTGSGKSTTIASMIDIINSERECHILTIEDPIEYLHSHKSGMVNQRELGTDTDSFNNALRAAMREDPDVILVGEMRDLETIAAAITLAETGHLVFATLHTRSAPATIDRIVDVFPAHQQEQVRIQLSTSIEAVIAQQLLPRLGGGRVAAIEIMIATSALRNLIREGKTYQIYSVIETGHQYGMQAMDRVLSDLHRSGQVTFEEAVTRAIDRENFQRLVKGF